MQTAAIRGKLLEFIATADRPHDKNHQDRAFTVGILSLLDTLLGIRMSQIVETLSIQQDMRQALIERKGILGKQLELIETNEKGEIRKVIPMLAEQGFLEMSDLTNMELEAYVWASRISDSVSESH